MTNRKQADGLEFVHHIFSNMLAANPADDPPGGNCAHPLALSDVHPSHTSKDSWIVNTFTTKVGRWYIPLNLW